MIGIFLLPIIVSCIDVFSTVIVFNQRADELKQYLKTKKIKLSDKEIKNFIIEDGELNPIVRKFKYWGFFISIVMIALFSFWFYIDGDYSGILSFATALLIAPISNFYNYFKGRALLPISIDNKITAHLFLFFLFAIIFFGSNIFYKFLGIP